MVYTHVAAYGKNKFSKLYIPSEQSLPVHPGGHTQVFGAVHMWLLSQLLQIAEEKELRIFLQLTLYILHTTTAKLPFMT